jgi:hypothetical protein
LAQPKVFEVQIPITVADANYSCRSSRATDVSCLARSTPSSLLAVTNSSEFPATMTDKKKVVLTL